MKDPLSEPKQLTQILYISEAMFKEEVCSYIKYRLDIPKDKTIVFNLKEE